jgi:chromosomal replication initiation ATPase DnaA
VDEKAYIEAAIKAVIASTGIPRSGIISHLRDRPLSDARHMAWFLLRNRMSPVRVRAVAEYFGVHHSTVIHGARKMQQLYWREQQLRQHVDMARTLLRRQGHG